LLQDKLSLKEKERLQELLSEIEEDISNHKKNKEEYFQSNLNTSFSTNNNPGLSNLDNNQIGSGLDKQPMTVGLISDNGYLYSDTDFSRIKEINEALA
jgi:hypothetical protein